MARRKRTPASGGRPSRTAEMVRWALVGLDIEIAAAQERLDVLVAQAAALRGRSGTRADAAGGSARGPRRKRTVSPATRRRLSELLKQRWAARRAGEKKR